MMRCWFTALTIAASLLAACDPLAPSASGQVTLGSGATTAAGASLELRMFPDTEDAGSFDPSRFSPPPVDSTYSASVPLDQVTFPYAYDLGDGVGTSPQRHWFVVAWLAPSAGAPLGSGEWFGARAMDFDECGGAYCGQRDRQDILVDRQAP